jgi:hypothetical protein
VRDSAASCRYIHDLSNTSQTSHSALSYPALYDYTEKNCDIS